MNLAVIFAIIALYFALILGVIVISRFHRTGSILPGLAEFLLASRSIPTFVLILTFVSSLFSTAAVIAFPSFVFVHGLAGLCFIAIGDLLGIVFLLLYYNKLRKYATKHTLYSPIECLSKSYASPLLGLICAVLMTLFLLPYISLQLVAIGAFLEGLSNGAVGYVSGVGFMMLVVLVYVILGGMRAVAFTDTVQGIAIFIGLIGGFFFFVNTHWDGVGAMVEDLVERRPDHWTLPGPQGAFTPLYFATSIIMVIGLFFQPQLLTRALMARNKVQVKAMGIGLAIALIIQVPITALIAIGATVIYAHAEPNAIMGLIFSDMAAVNLLGLVLSSLFLVGALGASMSTADSMLLTIGQMTTRDVIRPYKRFSHKRQVWLSRAAMSVAMAIAFIIGLNPPVFMVDLALASIAASCSLVPTYLGFTWGMRSKYAAVISILAGTSILIGIKFLGISSFGMHEGFVTLLVSSLVYLAGCFIARQCSMKTPSHTKTDMV